MGDGVYIVSIAVFAVRSDRLEIVAYSAAGQLVGTLLMLPSVGTLLERFGPRNILLASDAVRALALLALLTASSTGELTFALIGLVVGAGDALAEPALTVGLRTLLKGDLLLVANSANAVAFRIAALVGPVVGGVLVSWGFSLAISIDLVTFLASFVLVCGSRWPAPGTFDASSVRQAPLWVYLRENEWILIAIAAFAMVYAFGVAAMRVLIPAVLASAGVRPELFGFILAVQALGALVGSVLAMSLTTRLRPGKLIFGALLAAGGSMCAIGVSHALILWLCAAAGFGISLAVASVAWITLLQRNVEESRLGRIASLDWLTSLSLAPLVLWLLPAVVTSLGAVTVMGAFGAIVALVAALALVAPQVSRLELAEEEDSSGTAR